MGQFSYTALDASGNEIAGQLQADDPASAALILRQRGLRVMDLKQGGNRSGFLGQANFADWLASQRSVSTSSMIFSFGRWRLCYGRGCRFRMRWNWLNRSFPAAG